MAGDANMSVAVGDPATADWANDRPASASGSTTVTPTALNTLTTVSVTFPAGRFATPPAVVAIVLGGAPSVEGVSLAGAPTTTGVTFNYVQTSGTLVTRGIMWVAVEST